MLPETYLHLAHLAKSLGEDEAMRRAAAISTDQASGLKTGVAEAARALLQL